MAKETPVMSQEEVAEHNARVSTEIAAAVATSANVGGMNLGAHMAKRIEEAMVGAVEQALEDGVPLSNTEEILARKQAARLAVLEEIKAETGAGEAPSE